MTTVNTLGSTVLARRVWPTETYTVEHHPDDQGMTYSVHVEGGKYHGIVIHCPTPDSALRLFGQMVAYRMAYSDHPYLQAV